MPKTPRLIVFDLDGTALPAVEHRFFNQALIDAVTRLTRLGIHVTIATGRSHTSLMAEPTVAALRLRDPIIISGGALIVDPQDATQLYSSPLPENSMDNLLPVLTELNINRVLWDDYREEDFVSGGLALRDLPAAHHPYFLNLPMVKDSVLQELLRRVRELTGVRALPMRGLWQDHHEVHVLSTFATKYHAVKILQQHFGVTTEETVGIGDGHNDMDLFDAVGHAVAVDNAVEPLRQRAHELIGHVNENGLTHYLNTLAR